MGLFGTKMGGWEAKTEKLLICRIESKMKKFDTNFVESLLEGVKAYISNIMVSMLYLNNCYYLKVISLFREKNGSLHLLFFLSLVI